MVSFVSEANVFPLPGAEISLQKKVSQDSLFTGRIESPITILAVIHAVVGSIPVLVSMFMGIRR